MANECKQPIAKLWHIKYGTVESYCTVYTWNLPNFTCSNFRHCICCLSWNFYHVKLLSPLLAMWRNLSFCILLFVTSWLPFSTDFDSYWFCWPLVPSTCIQNNDSSCEKRVCCNCIYIHIYYPSILFASWTVQWVTLMHVDCPLNFLGWRSLTPCWLSLINLCLLIRLVSCFVF